MSFVDNMNACLNRIAENQSKAINKILNVDYALVEIRTRIDSAMPTAFSENGETLVRENIAKTLILEKIDAALEMLRSE